MTFRRFAFNNVLRNKRTYAAFFLSSAFSVMVFFVYAVFAFHPALSDGALHGPVANGMHLAEGIIYVFSFFFVLYSMSSFLKTRKKEFGLLMLHGMTGLQLRTMVFLENMLIGFFSAVCGIGVGLISAKLILMMAENLLELDQSLPFYMPIEAVVLTFVAFILLFMAISLFTVAIIRSNALIELIRGSEKPKREPMASLLLSLLAFLLLAIGYGVALWVRGLMVAAAMVPVTIIVIIGTYFLYTQLSVYIVRFLRNRRHVFWRRTNILLFSDLAYRMKDNARMFFIVTILSTVAFSAIGTLVGFKAMVSDTLTSENPYAFEYISHDGEEIEAQHLQLITGILEEEGIAYTHLASELRLQSLVGSEVQVNVVRESEYNALAIAAGVETVELAEHEALMLYYTNSLMNDAVRKPDLLRLVGSSADHEFHVVDTRASNLFPIFSSMYVLPDQHFPDLAEAIQVQRVHVFDVADWKATRAAGKRLSELLPGPAGGERGYSFFSLAHELHMMNQGFGAILFVGFFIGAVFFVAAGSFLYFRLYTDLDDDRRRFAAIRKLGLTDRELSGIISKQLALLFLLPICVATVHGAVALTALQHMFDHSLLKETVMVLGSFVLVQLCYFLLIRSRYIHQVKGA